MAYKFSEIRKIQNVLEIEDNLLHVLLYQL